MELSVGGCFPNLVRNCRWTILPQHSFWITLYIRYVVLTSTGCPLTRLDLESKFRIFHFQMSVIHPLSWRIPKYWLNNRGPESKIWLQWRERTNKMQLIRCLLSNFLPQHVSGIIMLIIRRIRPCPSACGVLPGCVGCGWLWSCGAASWAHDAAPQDHSQPQPTHPGRTSHAVGHGLILLMMGIMMPETCWDRKFDNKHRISCVLLVPSLDLIFTMHGHKNLKHEFSISEQTLE